MRWTPTRLAGAWSLGAHSRLHASFAVEMRFSNRRACASASQGTSFVSAAAPFASSLEASQKRLTGQVRFEDDGATQVCYKYSALQDDPVVGTDQEHTLTFLWEAAEIGRVGANTFVRYRTTFLHRPIS